jgi:hypothetical protein
MATTTKRTGKLPQRHSGTARKDGRAKVFWTPEERERLADAAARAIHSGRADSAVQALRAGQAELPEHRRRPTIHDLKGMGWFQPALALSFEQLESQGRANGAEVFATPPAEPIRAPEEIAKHLSEAMAHARTMVDDLIRLAAQLRRKPALLVVGLKGGLQAQLAHDFASRFEIRFAAADEPKARLRALTEGVETTVVMTDAVTRKDPKVRSPNYIRLAGGIAQLRTTLTGLT